MGKKGELLRQQKKDRVTYTFTAAQLIEHDKHVLESKKADIMRDCQERLDAEMKEREAEMQKMVEDEWHKREQLFSSGDKARDFFNLLSYTMAVSARVLVERFG